MRKKGAIIIAILIMSIGFASISTTLILNGNAKVSENKDDFSVIFTKASLDGKDVYSTVVDDTKKIINFSTSELKTLNQTSVLNYEVTNNSSNYDAEINVTCVPKTGTQAKYTSIKNKLENDATVVKAKSSVNGTLTITLDKTSTESVTEEYTCKLEFSATERDSVGESKVIYYYEFGTPTTSSTTDYTTLGKNLFTSLGTNGVNKVCINDNGLFCIKPNNYDDTVVTLKEHFGEEKCNLSSYFRCTTDTFVCEASTDGYVACYDATVGESCAAYGNEIFSCR